MNKKLITVVVFAIATAVVLFIWFSDSSPPLNTSVQSPQVEQEAKSSPEMQFSGTRIVGRKDGYKQFDLEISNFDILESEANNVEFSGLTSGMIYRGGEPYAEVKALGGTWNKDTNKLRLNGDVSVVQEGDQLLEAISLDYDGETESLVSTEPVTAKVKGMEISAETMRVDLKTNVAYLKGQVRAEHENGTRILAGEIMYDMDNKKMRIIGGSEIEIFMDEENSANTQRGKQQ